MHLHHATIPNLLMKKFAPRRKKISPELEEIDYKNVPLLRNFVDGSNRILGRKSTGLDARKQRMMQKAIKRARAVGIMPY